MNQSTHDLQTPGITMNQLHWRASDLLEVPPVLLVTEYEPVRLRQQLAAFVDGRDVNDALYHAVLAIKREYELEPHAYVVVFPQDGFEIPVDLREITDESSRLAGFLYPPRGSREVVFDYTQLDGGLADQLRTFSRDEALASMKQLSADGQEFTLYDRCTNDERFAHRFEDGTYRHNYRYVAAVRR